MNKKMSMIYIVSSHYPREVTLLSIAISMTHYSNEAQFNNHGGRTSDADALFRVKT